MADNDEQTLKRATTMEVTAEEGKKILAEEGSTVEETADHLRSGNTFKQGGDEANDDDTPAVKKTLTMAETVKEAEAIIGEKELGRTRGQDQAPAEEEEEGNGDDTTPSLTKTMTMAETLKDSAPIVESLGDAADAGTRAEAKQIEEAVKNSEEEVKNDHKNGDTDAATLKRKGTMVTTAEEGEEFLKRQKLSGSNGDDAVAKEVEA